MSHEKLECPECKKKEGIIVDTPKRRYDCAICRCLFQVRDGKHKVITHGTMYK